MKLQACVFLLAFVAGVQAQSPTPKDDCATASPTDNGVATDCATLSKAFAIKATKMLRDEAVDPTSFTVLEVVARTGLDKHNRRGFGGCIHFVAANRVGGRMQACGGYYTDKKAQLQVFGGNPAESGQPCSCANVKNGVDVTAEAKASIQ
jgi:hypothetical protein